MAHGSLLFRSPWADGRKFHEAKQELLNRFDGEESMFQLAQRIYNLLSDIRAQKDKPYVLVAHNGIARVVHSFFMK